MENEEFLAEMQRRRQAANPTQTPPPSISESSSSQDTEEKGLVGFVIRLGLAKDKDQANKVLLGIIVGVLVLIVAINFFF